MSRMHGQFSLDKILTLKAGFRLYLHFPTLRFPITIPNMKSQFARKSNSGYPPSATDFLYHPTTAGYGLKEESPVSLKGAAADPYPYGAAAASHHHAAYAAVYQEALVNPYAHHMTAAAASSAMQPTQPTGKRKRKSE